MRYAQLRAFHNVAVFGGFSRAAEALHLTQPAISDQVRSLEKEYDILLFDRSRRRVALTAAGQELLAITRRLFESESQALEYLSEARALRDGQITIVADAAHNLLRVLGMFRKQYPGVRVTLRAGNSQTVIEHLRSYEADIGVLGGMPDMDDFEIAELPATPIVAIVQSASEDAKRSAFGFEDLATRPLVFREDGSKTRTKLVSAARKAGVTLNPSIEAEGREAVREIVAAGGGVGFVALAEMGADTRLASVPIRPDAELQMEEAVVCLKDRSRGKLVRAFFEMVRQTT